jgi:hypothetical protein
MGIDGFDFGLLADAEVVDAEQLIDVDGCGVGSCTTASVTGWSTVRGNALADAVDSAAAMSA